MDNYIKHLITAIFFINTLHGKTDIKILNSTEENLYIEIEIDAITTADLYPKSIFVGLPNRILPETKIIYKEVSPIPFKSEQSNSYIFSWTKIQKLKNLNMAVLKIDPRISNNSYINKLRIEMKYRESNQNHRLAKKNESIILSNKIINWNIAKRWVINNKRKVSRVSEQPSGKWVSLQVYEDGIYTISSSLLKNTVDDIDNYDPRALMLFMSSALGRAMTQDTDIPISENMIEIPIVFEGESDGIFDDDDKIIFYGRGHSGFDINGDIVEWKQNLYFNSNKCWILLPDDHSLRGKRIQPSIEPEEISLTLDYGLSYYHYELDLVNPELSGLNWFGAQIASGSSQVISTNSPHAKENVDGIIELKLKGYSTNGSINTYHSIDLHANGPNINKIGNTVSWSGNGTRIISGSIQGENLNQSSNSFFIQNNSTDNNSSPYIDYLKIKYGRKLIFDSNVIEFFSP